MRMNPGIILAGQTPDIVGNVDRGFQAGRRNRLADLNDQHGAAAIQGDQNALAQMAQFDPMMAQQFQGNQLNMQAQQQHMSILGAQERRQIETHAAKMSAAERAAETQRVQDGIMRATRLYQAGDLNGLNAMLQSVGEQPLQSLDQFPSVAGMYGEALEILQNVRDFQAGPKPLSGPGKVQADINAGFLPENTPLRANPMQISIGADGQSLSGPLPAPPASDVPAGSARGSFGLTGLLGNAVNSVTDFVAGAEAFPEIGENVRFFRNLEEDLLVGLSQAYGRQPAQALMERLRKLLPNVGTTEGAQAAYRESVVMTERFERDLAVAQRQVARARTQSARQEAEARVLGIQSALEQLDEAQRRLNPQGDQGENNKTSSGVRWRVVE